MEINIKYINEIKKNSRLSVNMIKKDLVLSYILQELEFKNLIFKGGTLLSKGYLKYHRLSEDLDFTYLLPDFISKTQKIKFIKEFVKIKFIPKLIKISQKYMLDFENDIENNNSNRYCPVKQSDFLFRFNMYLTKKDINPIKIEINFLDKCYYKTKLVNIRHLNANSEYLIFPLREVSVLSYHINEIIIEKLRAILTRENIHERDFFDLYLLNKEYGNVLNFNLDYLISKLRDSRQYLVNKDEFLIFLNSFKNRIEDINNVILSEIEEMVLIDFNLNVYKKFVSNLHDKLLKLNFNELLKND